MCLACWLAWGEGGGLFHPYLHPAPLGLGDRHLPGLLVLVFYSILFYNLSVAWGGGVMAPSGSFRYSGIALSALANLKSLQSSASERIKKVAF
jgi:hypothetical protein